MTVKTTSERLAEAMEQTRRQWKLRIKAEAEAAAAATMRLDEFLAALKVVEDDHQFVLEKVQALRKAVSCLMDSGEHEPHQVVAMLQKLNDFLGTRFAAHLEEEERTLFPFLEQSLPEGSALVARLMLDHTVLLRKRQEFANCLEIAAAVVNGGLTRAVVLDLFAFGLELCELLDAHAHNETQAIRQSMVCRLPK
jgi:hemerythrin-like domain-containing protein